MDSAYREPSILAGLKTHPGGHRQAKRFDPRIKALWRILVETCGDETFAVEINVSALSKTLNVDRKTVRRWLTFMEDYRLLVVKNRQGGRGRGVLVEMTWLKRGVEFAARRQRAQEHAKTDHRKPQQHSKTTETGAQRHKSLKTHSSREQPPALTKILTPNNKGQWVRTMKAFRELLEQSPLEMKHARLCACVLGRHINGKTRDYGLKMYDKLCEILTKLKAPGWIQNAKHLCAWFMQVLKNLFKPKPRKKRYTDFNEYAQAMIEREREQVLRRRGHREPTLDEAWQRWYEEQERERAWKEKRASMARAALRS